MNERIVPLSHRRFLSTLSITVVSASPILAHAKPSAEDIQIASSLYKQADIQAKNAVDRANNAAPKSAEKNEAQAEYFEAKKARFDAYTVVQGFTELASLPALNTKVSTRGGSDVRGLYGGAIDLGAAESLNHLDRAIGAARAAGEFDVEDL